MEYIFTSHPIPLFSTLWSSSNVTTFRTLLATVISIDRSVAVLWPIVYHKDRGRVRNPMIVFFICCYPIPDCLILWGFCEYQLVIAPTCVNLGCAANKCYIRFTQILEVGAHSLITVLSLMMTIKLFIWNNCKKGKKSKGLERANYLALTDTVVIILFDMIPLLIISMNNFVFEDYGSLMNLSKISGYALEGYLVCGALKRKSVADGKSSVIMVKS
uniref:G_PROTEIN_RECEP_F1_2 domain-containing protein n=1 Tax=Caenorhabditis tropicalis TaxID=1561998 RepID=A0A1I7V2M0_9PELO